MGGDFFFVRGIEVIEGIDVIEIIGIDRIGDGWWIGFGVEMGWYGTFGAGWCWDRGKSMYLCSRDLGSGGLLKCREFFEMMVDWLDRIEGIDLIDGVMEMTIQLLRQGCS